MRTPAALVTIAALCVCLSYAQPVRAEGWDLSLFGGVAYPTYEQRFVVRPPSSPTLPGLVVNASGDLALDAKGGGVFGAALAGEFAGTIGVEARFDSTAVDLRTSGVRYDISYTAPPLPPLSGSITVGGGVLETDRLSLLSLNLRFRTPGPVSLVTSGGFSYLPTFTITGSTPVQVSVNGFPVFDASGTFRLRVAPTESSHRFGVNAGAGLRVRVAPRVALFGEGRLFYFKEYELAIDTDDPDFSDLIGDVEGLRFRPVVVNAVGGIVFSF